MGRLRATEKMGDLFLQCWELFQEEEEACTSESLGRPFMQTLVSGVVPMCHRTEFTPIPPTSWLTF